MYYVSGHGFGHAVRSAEIIRALRGQQPEVVVCVRTSAPAWLFPPGIAYQAVDLDAGVIQPDALRVDEACTLRRAAELARGADRLVAKEVAALRRAGAGLVVGDVPPLAFLAARAAGLPSVAVANFSWDWIYAPYVEAHPEYRWLLDWLRRCYRSATRLLRLPFHGDLSAFSPVEDVPLVSRPASAPRATLRARLGARPTERLVLLSFGGLGLSGLDPGRLGELSRYTFLATAKEIRADLPRPANVRLVSAGQDNYTDLLAACDAVVSKPGFGIVANCLAERVPMLYTDRGNFAEYVVLVEALHRHGPARFISHADLLAADLGPHLDALLGSDQPWTPLPTDGAAVVARRLLELCEPGGG